MSTRLRSRPRRPRLAPPGSRHLARGLDRAPDGWTPVRISPQRRLFLELDRQAILAATAFARRVSRREFIQRTAALAASVGLGTSGFIWGAPALAADGVSPCGPNEWGCGSSPICPDSVCAPDPDGPGKNCDLNCGCGGVWRRVHVTTGGWADGSGVSDCAGPHASNCWREDCCSSANHNRRVRCCDCCVPPQFTGGGSCTCSNPKRKCICRTKLTDC